MLALLLFGLRRRGGAALLLVLAVLPPPARAFRAGALDPKVGTEGLLVGEGAGVPSHLGWRIGVLAHHAHHGLVAEDSRGETTALYAEDFTVLDVSTAAALFSRLELGASVPVALAASGEHIDGTEFRGVALGDPRLMAKASLIPRRGHGLGVALAMPVSLPLGDQGRWLGDEEVTTTPSILVDGQTRWVYVMANLGYHIRSQETVQDRVVDDALRYDVGAALRVNGRVSLMGELVGSTLTDDFFGGRASSPLEALGALRVRLPGCLVVTLGGGGGMVGGIGAPAWRAFGGFSHACASHDVPIEAAAPTAEAVAERAPAPAPVPKTAPPPKSAPVTVAARTVTRPAAKAAPSAPKTEATPPLLDVGHAHIVGDLMLLDVPLRFTRRHRVHRRSRKLLDDIAALMARRPDIKGLRIEGHTDSSGSEALNLRISSARARAVRRRLVRAGVAEARLEVMGRGESMPIESNRTRAGRRSNRRIEFHLVR